VVVIDELLDDAALMSFEHQEHMIAVLGEHRWDVTFRPPSFIFTAERAFRCTRFHVLGSAAPGPRSWLWSWANEAADYPAEVTDLAASVRDYGVAHGISLLAEGEVPFADVPGSPSDPGRVAWFMGELAKAVTGTWTSYTGDAGRGTRLAMLVEHPVFELNEPDAASMSRVVDAVFRLQLPDHRRALHSYAVRRGLAVAADQDHLRMTGPGFETTVRFTVDGLIAASSTSRRPEG
jgi:hypothetical protein